MIPINQGISFRYIIQTDIFIELQKKVKNIILIVPDKSDSFYKDQKLFKNVIVEDYRQEECEQYILSSKIHRLLRRIRSFVQNGHYDISTTKGHHAIFLKDFYNNNKASYFNLFILRITNIIIVIARRSKVLRKLILIIENKLFTPNIHFDLFNKYKPDILLVASLGTFDYDQLFMRQARKNGVKVISIILSWDNTTTRGYPAAYSDLIISWTEIMKKELIQLNDIDKSKIQVGGVALYDHYNNNNFFYSRNELNEILKIDKKLDFIFFATKSPNCYVSNDYVAELILEAINKKKLIKECHLLVRLHPIFFRRVNGEMVFARFLKDFKELSNKNNRLTINGPKIISKALNYSMPNSEIKLLASILKHSCLMINIFSSLNIEASIFDIPIINVAFEGKISNSLKKARLNIHQDLNETHNQRIVNSGGVKMVYNEQQLIPAINEELSSPSKRQKGRQNILQNETGPNSGIAGKKIANLILNC